MSQLEKIYLASSFHLERICICIQAGRNKSTFLGTAF